MTFIERVGGLLTSPLGVMRHVYARKGGGLTDALILLALGVVALDIHRLLREVMLAVRLDLGTGVLGFIRIVTHGVGFDLLAILGASVVVTVGGGRLRRSAGRDVDLAACAWVPTFVMRVIAALTDAAEWERKVVRDVMLLGPAWSLVLLGVAIYVVRKGPPLSQGRAATSGAAS